MVRRKSIKVSDRAEEMIGDDDRISRLPIELIHQIYSLMDTRFCVQSSLLSRRWRNIWKSQPYLNFKIETDPYTFLTIGSKFPNFVHRFLSTREKHAELVTIDFRSNSIKLSLLKEIVTYAISHRTQKLNIEYLSGIPTRRGGVDLSLFKSRYLQEVSLNIDFEFLKTPTLTWDLPALTTLHLERVTFTLCSPNNDGSSSSSSSKSLELFSTFSNLKTLVLVHCRLWDIHTFYITSSGLKNLTLERILHHSCRFVITAPKLSSFTYNHMAPCSFLANNLDSLETVIFRTIYGTYLEDQPKIVEFMIDTFHQLYNAKFLTLNTDALRFLSRFPELLERRGCPFVRLQSLTLDEKPHPLSVVITDIINYFRGNSSGVMVTIKHNPTSSEQVVIRFS